MNFNIQNKCASCRTIKPYDDFINENRGTIMKCCNKCRTKYNKTTPNKYENKKKCSRCGCWRNYENFLKNGKELKCCDYCRTLSLNHMKKKKS